MRRGSAAMMRAGDDDDEEEKEADADEDADGSDGGLESVRVAMDGEGVDKAIDGFADLVADANEIGNADAVRLAPL